MVSVEKPYEQALGVLNLYWLHTKLSVFLETRNAGRDFDSTRIFEETIPIKESNVITIVKENIFITTKVANPLKGLFPVSQLSTILSR